MRRVSAAVSSWLASLPRATPPEYAPVRHEAALVAAIVLFGALLRYLGLTFGLPYFHHWDEPNITDSVRDMIVHGDDVPRKYFYGEPMMRLTELVYLAAGRLHVGGFAGAVLDDDVYTRVAGRFVNATLSSTGTLAVYLAARFSLRRAAPALAAALLYATSCELVVHARYCVTDAGMTALTAWVLCACAWYALRPTVLSGLVACALGGLTAAYKLTGFLTLAMIVPTLVLIPVAGWIASRSTSGPADFGRPVALRVAHTTLAAAALPIAVVIYTNLNPHVVDHWRDALANFEEIADKNAIGEGKPDIYRSPGLVHALSAVWYVLGGPAPGSSSTPPTASGTRSGPTRSRGRTSGSSPTSPGTASSGATR